MWRRCHFLIEADSGRILSLKEVDHGVRGGQTSLEIEKIVLEKAFRPVLVKFPQTKFTRTALECQKMLLKQSQKHENGQAILDRKAESGASGSQKVKTGSDG